MKDPKRMKGLRKAYPEQKEFYETADGHVFLDKNHADDHIGSLKSKVVTTISAAQIDAVIIAEEGDTTDKGELIPAGTVIEETNEAPEDNGGDETGKTEEAPEDNGGDEASKTEEAAPEKPATKKAAPKKKATAKKAPKKKAAAKK